MKRPCWALLALSSFVICPLASATRPRYGGALTVDLTAAWATLDPSEMEALAPLMAETLVRLNERGEPEPHLAANWQHDADRKRWRFSLRSKVNFHDGESFNAATAAPALLAALKKRYGEVKVMAGGQTIVIQAERALPDLLSELSLSRSAVFRKTEQSALIGTGPFRVTKWEPGRRLSLAAFDDYWNGRPYLDSVIVNLGSTRTNADIFDIPFASGRRILPERTRVWSSPTRELIALQATGIDPQLSRALALCIDRGPMVSVLTQRKGEAAFGLLPQWLSGYAFLFAATPDVARARQIVSQLRLSPLTLSFPANDSFARSVADRVALNARDAGIALQPTPGVNGNVHLVRWPLESRDAANELARLFATLGSSERPDSLYDAERAVLEEGRVIPLLYLPAVYGISPRVHGWDAAQKQGPFVLHLENIWVEP
jgi:Bacterial extracellular solute-binding proteins, family 5 Middle